MNKTLIIAEKPSVAADIARALGGFIKRQGYYESEQYILSSASGHLLEIHPSKGFEPKKGKWQIANLPVLPQTFELRPIPRGEARLRLLLQLIKRQDISKLINACDAGREGELIFRYIIQYSGTKKPVQRLWLQSMTPASIREGFDFLRSDAEMMPLADAAICRSESDWLVGINGTRAMTSFNSKHGGFFLTTVGRVQTPTLMIVVEREEKIKKIIPKDFWEVKASFQAAAGEYTGTWIDKNFAREKGAEELKPERIWNERLAEEICQKCSGKPGTVTEESKPVTQVAPLLYDLTSLQREANSKLGFSARRTLQVAQRLYEHHKVLTYPRTDARALPEDYIETSRKVLLTLSNMEQYAVFARRVLDEKWVHPNKRIFNNAKISDHFAIIPTNILPRGLHGDEARIYDMVAKRFLAVFHPPAEYMVTTRITTVEQENFKSEGKVVVKAGWLAVYGRDNVPGQQSDLTPVKPGEVVQTLAIEIIKQQTKPPAHFTEATLLSAMEGAGKLVEDEELREAMSAKGLGTPATRAAIIEGLIYEKYLIRHGRELHPAAKAFSLSALLRGLQITELCSPEMTGDWEYKLKQMEHKQLNRPDFMHEIMAMTSKIVEKVKNSEHDSIPGDFGQLHAKCPKCGGIIKEQYSRFQCRQCDFFIWKNLAGRQFEAQEIETILSTGKAGPFSGFHSQKGKLFSAVVKLNAEHKIEFDFSSSTAGLTIQQIKDEGKEPLGGCPLCKARVFDAGTVYVCENGLGNDPSCSFRCSQTILRQPIDKTQITRLLETGRSDLLSGFISRKGRPFKAYLVLKEGKVAFEFLPRKTKERNQNPGVRSQ
jgi:DNA topoisomerase-3